MKIFGIITNQELKKRMGWFLVLMIWVGMVTAVIINRVPGEKELSQISKVEGYVEIQEDKLANIEVVDKEKFDGVVSVAKSNKDVKGNDFFIEYRIDRDQARSEQINLLREMINNPNSDKGLKAKAQERLLILTNSIEKEMEIESLVRARGYQDGIAFIHDKTIELIVCADVLSKEDVAKLGDIIKNTTNISLDNITIIEKKPE